MTTLREGLKREPHGLHLLMSALMGTNDHLLEKHGVRIAPGYTAEEKKRVITYHRELHRLADKASQGEA